MINESRQIKKMLSLGVNGYLVKNCNRSELKTAIKQVIEGGSYYSLNVMREVMEGYSKKIIK